MEGYGQATAAAAVRNVRIYDTHKDICQKALLCALFMLYIRRFIYLICSHSEYN